MNGWGPNINIIRDPRYGRNSELPYATACPLAAARQGPASLSGNPAASDRSEDPTLSGHYAAEMVRGMQEGDDPKYMKVHASLCATPPLLPCRAIRRSSLLCLQWLLIPRACAAKRACSKHYTAYSVETNRAGIDE